MTRLGLRLYGWLLVGALLAGGCAEAIEESDKIPATSTAEQAAATWTVVNLPQAVQSPNPYTNNLSQSWNVEGPALATRMRVHFSRLEVERNYDYVRVYDGQNRLVQTFTGSFTGWTGDIEGNVARVELRSDRSVTGRGFSIDSIQYILSTQAEEGEWIVQHPGTPIRTAHSYANNTRQKWTITAIPEATRVRVDFEDFATEGRYDFVYLYDGTGRRVASYDGRLGDFTSVAVAGNVVTIELVTDSSVRDYGFDIVDYSIFLPPLGCSDTRPCEAGYSCQQVTCIRWPCPAQCVLDDGATSAAACDMTDGQSCASGFECGNVVSETDGACATNTWSTEALIDEAHTPHPVENNMSQQYWLDGPEWADEVVVQFEDFDLESNYDFARVFDAAGTEQGEYTGNLGDFDGEILGGGDATIELTTDESVTRYGFDVNNLRVNGLPSQLAVMSFDPRQCDAGVAVGERNATESLASRGIPVYGYRSFRYAVIACMACACPTGMREVFVVSATDVPQLVTLGFRLFDLAADLPIDIDTPTLSTINPIQCGGNRWEQWWNATYPDDPSSNHTEEELVTEWAESLGVTVEAAWSEQYTRVVCRACSCPRGYTLSVLTSNAGAQILRANGFGPTE